MSNPLPFRAQPGVPLVGQPFTLTSVGVPVNAALTCNCGGPAGQTDVVIAMSQPGTCPSCGKVYHMAFNPLLNKLEIAIGVPQADQVPS